MNDDNTHIVFSYNINKHYQTVVVFRSSKSAPAPSCRCLSLVPSHVNCLSPFTAESCYRVHFVAMVTQMGSLESHIVPEIYSTYYAKWVTYYAKQSDNICSQGCVGRLCLSKSSYFIIIIIVSVTEHPPLDWLDPGWNNWNFQLFNSIENKSASVTFIALLW